MQLWYPYYRLREEGFETFTIGPEQGKTYNSKHGYPCKAEVGIDDVNHEVEQFTIFHFDTAFFFLRIVNVLIKRLGTSLQIFISFQR